MKAIIPGTLLILCLWVSKAGAQTVVNTTGNTISNAEQIFEYSIGEIGITTLSGTSNTITQGLLQPSIKIIDPACQIINDTLMYFPTPTQRVVSVVTRLDWITGYHIYAADGKLVRNALFVNNQIDMSNLPAGVYFVRLHPGCNNKYRVLKVMKQ
jgi:hypothetical protein